jgi:hypothetical protein
MTDLEVLLLEGIQHFVEVDQEDFLDRKEEAISLFLHVVVDLVVHNLERMCI